MAPTHSPTPETPWLIIIRLLRWHKPAGRLILLIPALWAIFVAGQGQPPLALIGVIIVGTLATSAAGCVANDLWDRNIDTQVDRTRDRPLAARTLSVQVGAMVMAIAFGCALALALYLYQTHNSLTFWLSVGAFPFIVLYPGAKRVFPVPQLVLSLAWGFAVLISWTAVTGRLEPGTWWLWGAVVLWTLGFDTIYALSDREDDRKIGIHSSALFFGDRAPEAVGLFFLGTVALLGGLGMDQGFNGSYWLTLGLATALWIWQYGQLRQPRSRAIYGQLFSQNVLIGFVLLAGIIVDALGSSV
ncbi:4-hydroxybenzoate solanesyltransferase [Prochlorothrix hollandica]|uniref:4-hydroxybenzoate solanesyltransferase n=2 Tax=Prochlorothrix hollandica TaxID=1223 RepID=A0A0M2PWT2_PROHO|nr:4-hydroxybenzoate solanesyltransferase [Prochlorothrix hollandica]KKI98811.1 4-hydroxybenzoate polyprenyltransferase [Prochlorothrix hollandica PCC 9006 = CALU 1027]